MAPYSDYVRDQYQRPVPGALVYVYDKANGQLANLQTQSGGSLPNPVKTDALGLFSFYADDATYRREIRLDNGLLLDASDIIVGKPPEFTGATGANVQSAGPAETFADAVVIQSDDLNTRQVIADGYQASGDLGGGLWVNAGGEVASPSFTETRAAKKTKDNYVLRLPKNEPVRLSRFGIRITDALLDQQAALQDTFDVARAEGYAIVGDPYATYRKDGVIQADHSFDGQGCTFQPMSDGDQAFVAGIIRSADGIDWRNFTILGAATARTTNLGGAGVIVGDLGRPVSGFLLENVHVGSVDDPATTNARGVSGSAFYFGAATRGRVIGCTATRSWADGYHVIHGSKDITFISPKAYYVGDDAFPVVSYVGQGLCERILWLAPYAENGRSRGCAVIGGRDVTYIAPQILNCAGAGAAFASEASFNTYGVDNCHIYGGTFLGPCQGADHLGPAFRSAGVYLLGRTGSDTLPGGEVFDRSVRRSSIEAAVRGQGPAITQVVDTQSEQVIRCRVDLTAYDMATANGYAVGGVDTELRFRGSNIGGLLGFVGPTARGRINLDVDCDGSRVAGTHPFNNQLYIQGDDVDEVNVTGKMVNGPTAFIGANTFTVTKLRWRDTIVNGVKLPTRDMNPGALTYLNGWSAGAETPTMDRNEAGLVTIGGQFSLGTGTAGTIIASRPNGFRNVVARTVVAQADDGSNAFVRLDPNGDVVLLTTVTTGLKFPNITFQAAA